MSDTPRTDKQDGYGYDYDGYTRILDLCREMERELAVKNELLKQFAYANARHTTVGDISRMSRNILASNK